MRSKTSTMTSTMLTLTIRLDTANPRDEKILKGIVGAIFKELNQEERAKFTKQLEAELKRIARKVSDGKRNAQRRRAGKARSKRRVYSEEMGVK